MSVVEGLLSLLSNMLLVLLFTVYLMLGRYEYPPKHLDTSKGSPLRLPKPLPDQFPVRVYSCPLCI